MGGFAQDLRYALRLMRRRPGVTTTAVLTFALGIGANTAMFSVVNSVLLKPLPYPASDRLIFVSLALNTGFGERTSLSMVDFLAWRAANRACATVAAYDGADIVAVSSIGEAEAVVATARFFDVLGVQATLGRVWQEGDDRPRAPATVIVSHSYWVQRLSSDPAVIGRTLRIDGQPFTILGVAPAGFGFPSTRAQLWTILRASPPSRRGPFFLRGIGVIKPGGRLDQVRADLDLANEEVQQTYPSGNPAAYRAELLKSVITGDVRAQLVLLLGAVILVLLVAIVNVANLLLARAAERDREIAVRIALGAGQIRIVRQLVTEGLLLALAGGVAGCLLGSWATHLLVAAAPASLPRATEIQMDMRVLVFTLLTATVSGVLFAVSPALRLAAHVETMQSGVAASGRGVTRRIPNGLVMAEIALALTLTVGAVLLFRSLIRLERVDVGFRPERLLTASIEPPRSRYQSDARIVAFFDDLLGRVKATPGVVGASVTNSLPPNGLSLTDGFVVEDRLPPLDRAAPVGPILSVDNDYFHVLGAQVLRGRVFTSADTPTSPRVAIVSASLARTQFGDLDPVGRRIKQVTDWPKPDRNPWLTIVGVVGDVKYAGLAESTGPAIYVPLRQLPFRSQNLIVRVSGDSRIVVSGIRAALTIIDPDVPLADVQTMDDRLQTAASEPRFRTWLMALFGAIALTLVAIGIYGVLSCSVVQRTREIGIRAALGATKHELIGMVLRESLTLAAVGVMIGLVLTLSVSRFLATLLFGVRPTDLVTLGGATAILVVIAMLSALLPARRAASVDPSAALRSE